MKNYFIGLLLRLLFLPLAIIWLLSSFVLFAIWVIVILFLGEPYANNLNVWWLDLPDKYQDLIDLYKRDN